MTGYPWNRFVMPHQYAPSSTGAPLPGALLYFYESGTATPLDTYSDSTLSTPNTNPVVADQYGMFGEIFLKNQAYKVVLKDADDNEQWTADPDSPFVATAPSQTVTSVIEMTVDGNDQVPSIGICGDLYVPFDCTITAAVLQADLPGDVIVDVWAALFVTNTPPTATDSITASDPPTLASSVSSIDTALTGWTLDVVAGTWLRFNIVEIDTITRFTLSLVVTSST